MAAVKGSAGASKIQSPSRIDKQPTYSKPSQKASPIKTGAPKSGTKSEGAPRFKGGAPLKTPSPSAK